MTHVDPPHRDFQWEFFFHFFSLRFHFIHSTNHSLFIPDIFLQKIERKKKKLFKRPFTLEKYSTLAEENFSISFILFSLFSFTAIKIMYTGNRCAKMLLIFLHFYRLSLFFSPHTWIYQVNAIRYFPFSPSSFFAYLANYKLLFAHSLNRRSSYVHLHTIYFYIHIYWSEYMKGGRRKWKEFHWHSHTHTYIYNKRRRCSIHKVCHLSFK